MAKINLNKKELKDFIKKELSNVIQENWGEKLSELQNELDLYQKDGDEELKQPIISPGLELKHKKSGINFTVKKIIGDKVFIADPKGLVIPIKEKDLEKFELA